MLLLLPGAANINKHRGDVAVCVSACSCISAQVSDVEDDVDDSEMDCYEMLVYCFAFACLYMHIMSTNKRRPRV